MDVLVVNTYGGSLILGARLAGAEVVGSLENSNFGVGHQRLNFPELEVVPTTPWPDLDLSDVWVLAHPPCSAFSVQTPKHKKGQDTDAFGCHRRVIDYALGSNCRGLALESVAQAGAALPTYRELAAAHGYQVSLVYLNAASFGAPQWRPRVWVIFRRDFTRGVTVVAPTYYRTVGEVVRETGTEIRPRSTRPLDPKFMSLMTGSRGYGLLTALYRAANPSARDLDEQDAREAVGRARGEFANRMPRLLHPDDFAPVLMATSHWFVATDAGPRLVFLEEYCSVMGFPTDYKWPRAAEALLYLSKGVCPPVVPFVLELLGHGRMEEVNDLRPKRADALRVIKARRGARAA